jgi:hypothetical protein
MSDKPVKPARKLSEAELAKTGVYQGYDIHALRELGEEHPDFYLVAEFDKKFGPKAKKVKKE